MVMKWAAAAAVLSMTMVDAALDQSALQKVQQELDAWSANNDGQGIQLVVGNAYTGEEEVISAGNSAPGKPVTDSTLWRVGGMTKFMSGIVAAKMFKEGLARPDEPVSKYIPELKGLQVAAKGGPEKANRECTLWDLIGQRCGFSSPYWGAGSFTEAGKVVPADQVLPALAADAVCGGVVVGKDGKVPRETEWLNCRKSLPLIGQPGHRAFDGDDYEVLGLALARAAGKDAVDLMKEKVWDPLGITRAYLGWLPQGQTTPAELAEMRFEAPPATAYASGSAPTGLSPGTGVWASAVPDATWDALESDSKVWSLLRKFNPDIGGDAYPGVSGYSESAVLTFKDFAKILKSFAKKGKYIDANGDDETLICETYWRRMLSGTGTKNNGLGFGPGGMYTGCATPFSRHTEWKWGFSSLARDAVMDESGKPPSPFFAATSELAGQWKGMFGTAFLFDAESGLYAVGGGNTVAEAAGAKQPLTALLDGNFNRWVAQIAKEGKTLSPSISSFVGSREAAIQKELDDWSSANQNAGVQVVIGSSGGARKVFSAGKATPSADYSESTVMRVGEMGKLMAGVLAAAAFEEGWVKPGDLLSQYVPELAKDKLAGVAEVDPSTGATTVVPVERDITLWDLVGQRSGLGRGVWGQGIFRDAVSIAPADGSLKGLAEGDCGALGTAKDGKVADAAAWLDCRAKIPLLSQPGRRVIDGADYEVLGLALARASGKDAVTLMKEKVWDPLGISSANLGWIPQGATAPSDLAEIRFEAPAATAYDSGAAPSGLSPGASVWASSVSDWSTIQQDARMRTLLAPYALEQGTGAQYPGLSGYGESMFMTLSDFSKVLAMVMRKGLGETGNRVVGETVWKTLTEATGPEGVGFGPAVRYHSADGSLSAEAEWRWGHWGRRPLAASEKDAHVERDVCRGDGIFGTVFRMDHGAGLYGVGGENTMPWAAGVSQKGRAFVEKNLERWMSVLSKDEPPATHTQETLPTNVVDAIQQELNAWSAANGNRGVQLVLGSHTTQQVLSAGEAAPGAPMGEGTVLRIGEMTESMAGVLAAIAFEEGWAHPDDLLESYVPELKNFPGVARAVPNGPTEIVPLERKITLGDLVSMRSGLSGPMWGAGLFAESGKISPSDEVLPGLAAASACGAMVVGKDGNVPKEADWLACRAQLPLISQPGERAFDGADYEVLGLALARAAGKDAVTLMQEKVWAPLGIDSAFLAWATEQKGDVADIRLDSGPPLSGTWASATDFSALQADPKYGPFVGAFAHEVSGSYSGMSGYSASGFMTLKDFGKFVSALAGEGTSFDGKRAFSRGVWSKVMKPFAQGGQGLGYAPGGQYMKRGSRWSEVTEWRWGYHAMRRGVYSGEGIPLWGRVAEDSSKVGESCGMFGTAYKFDAATGFYAVGGENALPWITGAEQPGSKFINDNMDRWIEMISCATIVAPPALTPAPTPAPTDATLEPSVSPSTAVDVELPEVEKPKEPNCAGLSEMACQQTDGCKVKKGGVCGAAMLGDVEDAVEDIGETISDGWLPALLVAVGILTCLTIMALYAGRRRKVSAKDFHRQYDQGDESQMQVMKHQDVSGMKHEYADAGTPRGPASPMAGPPASPMAGAGSVMVTVANATAEDEKMAGRMGTGLGSQGRANSGLNRGNSGVNSGGSGDGAAMFSV